MKLKSIQISDFIVNFEKKKFWKGLLFLSSESVILSTFHNAEEKYIGVRNSNLASCFVWV
jgi:hypothetical protein